MESREDRPSRRAVLAAALARPDLRRLALTFCCFRTSEMGAWIAVITVAHARGGVRESAAVMASQLAPAALVALAVNRMVERFGVDRVLRGGLLVQAAGLGAVAGLVRVAAPSLLIYGAAIVTAVAVVTSRPTIATLLPTLVEDPHELTAANAVIGWLDGVSSLVGPLIAAIGLQLAGSWTPFAVFAVLYVLGAAVSPGPGSTGTATSRPDDPDRIAGRDQESAEVNHGSLDHEPAPKGWADISPILAVLAGHAFLLGAMDLLFVVVAIDVTGGPPARTAWLNTAFGVGALVGGAASMVLIGRRHLWPAVLMAGFGTAGLLAMVGISEDPLVAGLTLGCCGVTSAGLFVSARTLLQRVCDLRLLCRAFSLAEAFEMTMLLVGAVAVPFVVTGLGARWAPLGVGAVVGLLLILVARPMMRSEARVVVPLGRIEQLRAVELFASLPAPTLETLARQAEVASARAGQTIVAEGDPGDAYYVLVAGGVDVSIGGRLVNQLGPGDGFGELALLYDIPRTATVTATADCDLLTIDRWSFLVAVSLGSEPGFAEA